MLAGSSGSIPRRRSSRPRLARGLAARLELVEKPSQGLPERRRTLQDVFSEVPIVVVAHGDPGPCRVAVDPAVVIDQGEDQLHDGTVGTVPLMVGSGGSSKWPDSIGRPEPTF